MNSVHQNIKRCWLVCVLVPLACAGCAPQPHPVAQAKPAESKPAPAPVPPPAPVAPPKVELERVKAEAGVGKKGQSLKEHEGMVVTPVKQYFRIQQQLVFDIEVKHSLELYNATNGNYPKSHAEFMKDIIETNQIKLPELPDGHRYVYEPATHELMVERPKSATPTDGSGAAPEKAP